MMKIKINSNLPINNFIKKYAQNNTVRFHMPGHKGRTFHGMEKFDITEIKGADYLFESSGIIAQSESNMSKAFGTKATFYSCEGSSLCIKTMLGIIRRNSCEYHDRPVIVAPRNCHKAFINACILLDLDVRWVYPKERSTSICSSEITPDDIENAVLSCKKNPSAVYITSPDYLGNMCDIKTISEICHKYKIPLLVDNAHGAYLKFCEKDLHPISLGADMCCDSAHKTMPCYTGGALLHISENAPCNFYESAKEVMSMFASTSPSYLIMQSLDMCAGYALGGFGDDVKSTVKRTELCRQRISKSGWSVLDSENTEPMKITVNANLSGLTGNELAEKCREYNIECEYSDFKYIVFMPSVFNEENDFRTLENAFEKIEKSDKKINSPFEYIPEAEIKIPIREAAFSKYEKIPVDMALGKVCAMTVTCCQPSVPVIISGEVITEDIIRILKAYSIFEINVCN